MCSFRRMLFLVLALIVLCVIIVVVENYLTPKRKISHNERNASDSDYSKDVSIQKPTSSPNPKIDNESTSSDCWDKEDYYVKQECIPCSEFEKKSGHIYACSLTGFKEIVACAKSGDVHRSCNKIPYLEERKFWIFEGSMTLLFLLSATAVMMRQRTLDRRTINKIHKQIAAGV